MSALFETPFPLTAPQRLVVDHLRIGDILSSSRTEPVARVWIDDPKGRHLRWISERTLTSLYEKHIIQPTIHERHITWTLRPIEEWVDQ